MKWCPECRGIYDDAQHFCEEDGEPLVADAPHGGVVSRSSTTHTSAEYPMRTAWLIGTVGIVAGIALCISLLAAYTALTRNTDPAAQDTALAYPAPPVRKPTRLSARSAPETPFNETTGEAPTPLPTDEPTPVEQAETPAAVASGLPPAAPQSTTIRANINEGPVSTGRGNKESESVRTVIQLENGTAIEADAAWEDTQGIWYRRNGLVTFVESGRVKSITGRFAPESSSAANP